MEFNTKGYIRAYGAVEVTLWKNGDTVLTGKVRLMNEAAARKDGAEAVLKQLREHKPEILAELRRQRGEEERAALEKLNKVNAIPGLEELRVAEEARKEWRRKMEESYDSAPQYGLGVGQKPDVDSLRKKYPAANAYLQAEAWSRSDNYAKAAAGEAAMEKIANGEDYQSAIDEMEAKWAAHVQANMWD